MAAKQEMSPVEREALSYLDGEETGMLGLLERIVNIDSPTAHKAGVDKVGGEIADFLRQAGAVVDREPHGFYGDALHARIGPQNGASHVLLMGHMDTVFPVGEAARRPFRVEGGRAYGPGVADMKGGLVVNAFVLAALARTSAALPFPVAGLFTADEEIASPSSKEIIARAAKGARAVFNSEPGRPAGNVVTGRKGGLFMRFDVHGKAAHSGSAFREGISAIEELSRKIVKLHALSDFERGVTVNVGVVRGGKTLNTVAPDAEGEMDLRYRSLADRAPMLAAVERIIAEPNLAGTTAQLTITGEFLPLEPSADGQALYELYRGCGEELGHAFGSEYSGGCADSGVAAANGAPTLCGAGAVGGGSHTVEEYIELDGFLSRARTMALAILRLGRSG